MKRKRLLIAISGALLGLLTLMYSLVGAMTGVYSCPALGILGPGNPYVVRRGDDWHWVVIGNGIRTPRVNALGRERIDIRTGVWVMTMTVRMRDGAEMEIRAFAPWNLVDVYSLTFGINRSLGSPGPAAVP